LSRLAASSAGAVGICRIAMVVADHEPTPVRQRLTEALVPPEHHDPALPLTPVRITFVLLELLGDEREELGLGADHLRQRLGDRLRRQRVEVVGPIGRS
jgi:hypothetical protein